MIDFTARCYAERGIATASRGSRLSVRLSNRTRCMALVSDFVVIITSVGIVCTKYRIELEDNADCNSGSTILKLSVGVVYSI